MDYTYGIGKIYSKEDIENAKNSPSLVENMNFNILVGLAMYSTQERLN